MCGTGAPAAAHTQVDLTTARRFNQLAKLQQDPEMNYTTEYVGGATSVDIRSPGREAGFIAGLAASIFLANFIAPSAWAMDEDRELMDFHPKRFGEPIVVNDK